MLLYKKRKKKKREHAGEIGGDAKSGKRFFSDATKKGTGKYPTASVLVSMALGKEKEGERERALGYHWGRIKRAAGKYAPFLLAHVVWGPAFLVGDRR